MKYELEALRYFKRLCEGALLDEKLTIKNAYKIKELYKMLEIGALTYRGINIESESKVPREQIMAYLSRTFEVIRYLVGEGKQGEVDEVLSSYERARSLVDKRISEIEFELFIQSEGGLEYAEKMLELAEKKLSDLEYGVNLNYYHNLRIKCKKYRDGVK